MSNADFLLTPQGFRHKSLVRSLGRGAIARRENGHWKTVSSKGEFLEQFDPLAIVAKAPAPIPGDGWISNADWKNTTNNPVSSFTSTWIVPPAPRTSSAQTIFLFNSIQDTGGSHILQPVLQWGASAAPGSNNGWAIASWWVGQPTDPCFISDLVAVNVGDELTGRIELTGQNNGLFDYVCEFVGRPETRLTAQNLPQLTDCTETLETYGVKQASDYPPNAIYSIHRDQYSDGRRACVGKLGEAGAIAAPNREQFSSGRRGRSYLSDQVKFRIHESVTP